MLIGEMATRTGVSAKTLRFYEQAGLLHEPARTASGYRDYDPAAHDRVVFIRQAQQAGLTLRQINEILAIRDDGRPPCDHVLRLVDHQLAEIEHRLDELRRTRRDLRALRDRLAELDTSTCADDHICTAIDGQPCRRTRRVLRDPRERVRSCGGFPVNPDTRTTTTAT